MMKVTNPLGSLLQGVHHIIKVTSMGVSIWKEACNTLSLEDTIKLSKSAHDRDLDLFDFFSTNVKPESEFRTVYNLYMIADALYTALKYYDIIICKLSSG